MVDVVVGNGTVMFVGSSDPDDPVLGTGFDAALNVGGAWTEAGFVLTIGARGGGFVLTDTALTVVVLACGTDVLHTALDIGRSRTEAWVELASGAADNVGIEAGACTAFAGCFDATEDISWIVRACSSDSESYVGRQK